MITYTRDTTSNDILRIVFWSISQKWFRDSWDMVGIALFGIFVGRQINSICRSDDILLWDVLVGTSCLWGPSRRVN